MPSINLNQFGGMLPAWDGHLLPTGQAANARNCYLFSGALNGWRVPKLLRELNNSAARSVYRIPTVAQTQAKAYLVWLNSPADGDTLDIGDLTYTFKSALADVVSGNETRKGNPFDVLIEANAADTLRNLGNAITADSGENTNAGVQYGEDTPLNQDVRYFLPDTDHIQGLTDPQVGVETIAGTDYPYLVIGATDFGASFNLISVDTSAPANVVWLYDLVSLTHTTTTFLGGTNPTFNNDILGDATWLEFTDPDTTVFKSPIVEDQWNRYYSASPSQMPKYNTYDRIVAGEDFWLLGVPPPGCAVTLEVTGGGNNLQLGNVTQSGGRLQGSPNRIYLTKITTPGDTQIQDVAFVCSSVNTPAEGFPDVHFAALVYTDAGGKPDTLLNTGQIVTGVTADSPNISQFLNPTSLIGNTDYWIGFMIDGPVSLEAGPAGGANNTAEFSNTFTNGPPAVAPSSLFGRTAVVSDGINVANGDTLTIGLQTYVFQTTLTNDGPYHVHIGADATATLTNLEHAINASGGTPGTDYSSSTTSNLSVTAGAPADLAVELTARRQDIDATSVITTFTPVGSPPHLTLDGPTLEPGFEIDQAGLNMYGDFITSDIIESRSYVYTWVTEYGEEGPPSPPTLLDGWSNGVWKLGLWQPPPNDLGVLRNLKKINIYRTVPGQGGQTVFFFVDTVDIGTEFYEDSKPNNEVALNDQLESTNWFPPPENLEGFVVMQNGMVAAFTGNEIWFCEPFHPHAWPPGYVLTVDFPIVGLGVTNGALVVCTSANPYVISGTAPNAMTQVKCAEANPCSSRASILHGDGAVSYVSPNGLIQVTATGAATNTTDLWVTRDKWNQFVPKHDVRAIPLASCYFAFGSVSRDLTDTSVAQVGFAIELDQDNTSFSIWPQPGGHRVGFELLDSPFAKDVSNIQIDPWTGIGLMIVDGKVYYYDFTDAAPAQQVYTWKSKLYQQNAKRNYAAMKVYLNAAGAPDLNDTRLEADPDDAAWASLPDDRWGFIKTYVDHDGDGVLTLIDCREIRSAGELLRIVGGFKATTWQWEIIARVTISNVQIATSVKELAQL